MLAGQKIIVCDISYYN